MAHSTPQAGLIIIGNEILCGQTQDSNVHFIGQKLAQIGVVLRQTCIIPDIEEDIIETVRRYAHNYDSVFTTGGLGPTHDDITAAAMAKAFDTSLQTHPEAKEMLMKHYGEHINEARLRMALIPVGASLIPNPVSVAPGFHIRNVFVMAGVPQIVQGMMEYVLPQLVPGSPIFTQTIRARLAESLLANQLRAIQESFMDVEIGSYPYFSMGNFGTSLVVKSHNQTSASNAAEAILALIAQLGHTASIE
jgi:molybdenum cofactor synthesis domain-containing protein